MIVFVVGGGPAGQIAAAFAAQNGHSVTLFERNEKLGKKLYITGKGRCNVTNAADRDSFFEHVLKNPRFLYSAFSHFDNKALMERIERAGVPLKTERGGRVFPASDKSSDILRALEKIVREAGVTVRLNTRVDGLSVSDGSIRGIMIGGEMLPCDAVIVATGGVSYPQTGSTGDGYDFAKAAGHTVEPPAASLVPLETVELWPRGLAGLTLKNVTLTGIRRGKEVFSELGELLFTHFGVSGPLVLSLSGVIADDPAGTKLLIDLKPALDREQLDARLLRDLLGRRAAAGENGAACAAAAEAFGERTRNCADRRRLARRRIYKGDATQANRDAQIPAADGFRRARFERSGHHARRRQRKGRKRLHDGEQTCQRIVFRGRSARRGRHDRRL